MALEIEHKFLTADDSWRDQISHSVLYKQGYLSSGPQGSIRVRVADDQAWLNIKSATIGTSRLEFEYPIPLADANTLLAELCCKPLIEKVRHFVEHAGHTWEIDEFLGDNRGLIVAEIELAEVGAHFARPAWLGREVTDDVRYYNNNLSRHPFKDWQH